jgi:hypothetical protein
MSRTTGSRLWNAFADMTGMLENAVLMSGGVFAIKRVAIGLEAVPG